MDKVRKLVAACTIKHDKVVPWIAGRSRDKKIVWIDEDVPEKAGGVDPSETLPFHELGECLRQDDGEEYDKDSDPPGTAHYDGNGVEKIRVEELGGNWAAYCKEFRGVAKTVDKEKLDKKDLPPKKQWDLRPYEDDDRKLLEEILADEQGKASKAGGDRSCVPAVRNAARDLEALIKSTFSAPTSATSGLQGYALEGAGGRYSKAEAGYVDGPVKTEPCKDCVMFREDEGADLDDRCTLVSGDISARGHCKHFSAKTGKAVEIEELVKIIGNGRATMDGAVSAPICAGVAFVTAAGKVLFLKRSADSDKGGTWCFPGGHVEAGETIAQAAARECVEEIGFLPAGDREPCAHVVIDGEVDFTTFRQTVPAEFVPKLNAEHTDYLWAPFNEAPQPIHPWVKAAMPVIAKVGPLVELLKAVHADTLYVHRALTNVADFTKWAKSQGFGKVLTDPHVTIAWSKTPIVWEDAKSSFVDLVVPASDERTVEPLGDKGAVVLRFESPDLQKRWQEFIDAGASWDHDPPYKPHVSISFDAADVDLTKVIPYAGALEFGAEVFAPINKDWQSMITEKIATNSIEALLKDVSAVARDDHGRWTGGGSNKPSHKEQRASFAEAYARGQTDYHAGKTKNPYPSGSKEHSMWWDAQNSLRAVYHKKSAEIEDLLKDVSDVARDDHGRWTSSGKTTEQIAHHIRSAQAFLNSPEAKKVIAEKTKEFAKEHSKGLAEHILNHDLVLPAVHAATVAAITQMGGSHPFEAAAVIVAGYAVREVMKATGINAKGAMGLLHAAGRAALSEFKSPGLLAGKMAKAKDSVEAALEAFIKALEENTPEELLAAARSPDEMANDKHLKEGDTHPMVSTKAAELTDLLKDVSDVARDDTACARRCELPARPAATGQAPNAINMAAEAGTPAPAAAAGRHQS